MSIKAVEWAMKRQGISASAKLVLVMLADAINLKDEFAYPSQETIASVIGRSDRQVRTHIKTLSEKGLIRCIPGAGMGRGGGRAPDQYYLACDHRTGVSRPFTGGSQLPAAKHVTGGEKLPPVNVTGGSFVSLQPEVSCRAYIEEPESEPEECCSNEQHSHGFGLDGEAPAKRAKPAPKPKAKRKRIEYAPAFLAIWNSWPAHRRELSNKRQAFERWQSGVSEYGEAAIASAAKRYLSQPNVRKENHRYCVLVEVFMNGKLEAAVEAARGETLPLQDVHSIPPERWELGLSLWRERRQWITSLGPNPDHPGYRGPPVDQGRGR